MKLVPRHAYRRHTGLPHQLSERPISQHRPSPGLELALRHQCCRRDDVVGNAGLLERFHRVRPDVKARADTHMGNIGSSLEDDCVNARPLKGECCREAADPAADNDGSHQPTLTATLRRSKEAATA
jgi:hypothetical protein